VGQEDSITPPSDAEALSRAIVGSELVVVPRAGHLSNLEAPDDFSTAVARFLATRF
jgi:pimeloyl-ACP methyl ester carboxylesterase